MRKVLCWLLGHDRMATRTLYRICDRCGTREMLRNYGHVRGWEEIADGSVPSSKS